LPLRHAPTLVEKRFPRTPTGKYRFTICSYVEDGK
jgi:hypothetical protein